MLSREGIGIVGQNVTIEAAQDANSVTETQKFTQSGINVSLKGGAVDTAMAVKNSVDRAGQVQDDRLAALHLAQAGQTLFSGGQAGMNSLKGAGDQFGALADTTRDTKATGNNGLSLRIGIGASKSSSSMEYNATTAAGSRIASEGDVVIHATGDGKGNGGDLTVTGSQIEGNNVTLAAARDLLLQAQQETSEQIERNKASSGEIGITLGSEAGIGVYVSASAAKGKGDGNGTTHAETTVDAANTLTLVSGRDTTLEGAQARGETVIADIGRNLTMTSQQDTNDYARKDQSAGIDAAFGTGGGQVSASYNQSKIDSTYTSVKEQTGIQAGEGGFDIRVGGHTQLNGAAIASAADPSRNRLETGSLGWSDLENEAEYKASSFGISASGGSGGGGVSPNISVPQHEKSGSTTQAGIADGTLIVHDGSGEGIARGVTELQQDGLKEIFDQQKVAERMEMGQVAGQVGFTAAGDLAGRMGWEEGSKERAMLHGAVGAAMAALGGGDALEGLTGAVANQAAHKAIYDYLSDELKLDPQSGLFASLMQAGSLAVGAAVSGEDGAAVALNATQNNWLKHREAEELKSAEKACSPENQAACQRVEELRALDRARDYEYALYATSVRNELEAQGVTPTLEAFDKGMDGYWAAYGISQRDAVYPDGGFIRTYPTMGQDIYEGIGVVSDGLPDWHPSKVSAGISTALLRGVLEQAGEKVAAWNDWFNPGQGVNWFTGDAVSGVNAWDARFGGGAELLVAWLSGGGSNAVKSWLKSSSGIADDAAIGAGRSSASQGSRPIANALADSEAGTSTSSQAIGDFINWGEDKVKVAHTLRWVKEKGMDVNDVVRVIESDAIERAGGLGVGQGRSYYVNYDGRVIEYSAYRQPDGKLKIGSIRPDPVRVKEY